MSESPEFERCTILKDENVIYSTLCEELKPCDCSGKAKLYESHDVERHGYYKYRVFCTECGEHTKWEHIPIFAIDAWNIGKTNLPL